MWLFAPKTTFFEAVQKGVCTEDAMHLKFIQDAWFHLYFLEDPDLGRVVEIGGGASRTLPKLVRRGSECWNADRFEGVANGPLSDNPALKIQRDLGVKFVSAYVGDFSEELPEQYFDLAYSISVLEHLDHDQTVRCFNDAKRILKPGGRILHAVDLFLADGPLERTSVKISSLRRAAAEAGLVEMGADEIGEEPTFRTRYATPADVYLARKWCFTKQLQALVEANQLVTLIMGHRTPA
ncbi:MAG: class I SAM-dependent methyltransferase [Pseudomonadota bacterium]